jgi:hypothetical protein
VQNSNYFLLHYDRYDIKHIPIFGEGIIVLLVGGHGRRNRERCLAVLSPPLSRCFSLAMPRAL